MEPGEGLRAGVAVAVGVDAGTKVCQRGCAPEDRSEPHALLTTVLGLCWGLTQGVRHALEPDHLAAVATLVADRRSPRAAASYAVLWGAGHALVLLLVGGSLYFMRAAMPDRTASLLELAVAAMLVWLGVRALWRSRGLPLHPLAPHVHAKGKAPVHGRPMVVGCIHGLAGSGALAALVLSQMRSPVAALAYMILFGGGAALGMAALAGLVGVPLAHLARAGRGLPTVLAASGTLSLALGLVWGWTAIR